MVYGALRLLPRLRLFADRLLEAPAQEKRPRSSSPDPDRALSALAHEDAAACGRLGHGRGHAPARQTDAGRLVNALLRRFLRERESLLADRSGSGGALALPRLAADRSARDWPDDWERSCWPATRAPMSLRVNPLRIAARTI
jgi:16S rRNA (cytosine967-C5)-methyltransferase